MSIISLCGFSGAGKDTVAKILVDKYGYEKLWIRENFDYIIDNNGKLKTLKMK